MNQVTRPIPDAAGTSTDQVPVRIVDCDIHVNPLNGLEIPDCMPEPWVGKGFRELLFAGGMLGSSVIFAAPNDGRRLDSFTPIGPPGSDPGTTGRQLFDEAGVDVAIIIPMMEKNLANPEHEAAMAATINAWLDKTWLGAYNGHGRYKGTLRISTDPDLAVAEIEKWAGHPHFVQIMFNPYVGGLFGEPKYTPVYAAAIRAGLAICSHITVQRPGPALLSIYGPPTYYLENHGQFPMLYSAHLTSMICGGVFDRFPDLRFTFVEGGYAWALPFIWRMDKHWKQLKREVPGLQRLPSEYVRDQVSFTRQPVEEPKNPRHMARVIELLGPQTLEFATDYPHWDGDYDPSFRFGGIPADVRAMILAGNAIHKYRLSPTRPARHWSEFPTGL
jgi:predicted TIM-barrel fold metal-dependent hydrolase